MPTLALCQDGDIDDDFESFERMLVQLENTLLSSRSFLSAIEQNFDPSGRFKDTGFQLHEEGAWIPPRLNQIPSLTFDDLQ